METGITSKTMGLKRLDGQKSKVGSTGLILKAGRLKAHGSRLESTGTISRAADSRRLDGTR